MNVSARKLSLIPFLLICVGIGGASCGSSGGGASGPTAPPSTPATTPTCAYTDTGFNAPAPYQGEFTQTVTQCGTSVTKIVITNNTDSLVFLFTEAPSASPNMSVAPPTGDSDDVAQQAQNMTFGDPGSFSGSADLPPGDTLTVTAPYSNLMVVLNLAATRNQIVVNGVSAAFRSVLPENSEQKLHEAIQDVAQCAEGATQLPALTTSGDFDINDFWNEVPNVQSCYSAYSLWRDAADDSGSESESFSGIAKDFTSSFLEDTLPKLGEMLTTVLDHR